MKTPVFSILRKRYPVNEFALLEEVSNAPGFNRSRSADFVLMSLWPSRGLGLEGIELKSFRGDWLNEKKKPEKAESIFKYCDRFWLLTDGEHIAKLEEIPETWGWMEIKNGKIFVKKEAPKLAPQTMDRNFLACLLKRASCKEGYVRREEIQAKIDEARNEGQSLEARANRMQSEKFDELKKACEEYRTVTGIDLLDARWRYTAKDIGKAVKFVQDGGTDAIANRLISLESTAKDILNKITTGIESIKEQQLTQEA